MRKNGEIFQKILKSRFLKLFLDNDKLMHIITIFFILKTLIKFEEFILTIQNPPPIQFFSFPNDEGFVL